MRTTHLRQADLNLLVVFTVLAEERNVTRAADRLLLSQPAVSRALQRLRETFHDDLLIRTGSGYEPTPKGERLLQELSTTLPRLDRFLSGGESWGKPRRRRHSWRHADDT
jgi:DNA-binding transcriptional LysR family regulator